MFMIRHSKTNHALNKFALAALFVLLLSLAAGAHYPIVFTDDAGVTVTITEQPQRIISLAPSNTEILFAVGAGDYVVGVDDYSDFPAAALEKTKVGNLFAMSYETITVLEPDLIIVTDGEPNDRLRQLGFPVMHLAPQSFQEIYEGIMLVGRIVGNETLAAQVVADMKAEVAGVTDAVAHIGDDERRTVFYEVWHDPLMTAGPGSFMHEIIQLAGGVNVAEHTGMAWPMFSVESLVAHDPYVFITPINETIKDLAEGKRPALASLQAVTAGRVHWVDEDLVSRPSPRLTKGLFQVAAALYPELFEQ